MEVDACVHNVAQDRIVKQIMMVIPWCSQDLAHRTLVTHKTLEASLSALVPSSETPLSAAGAAVDSGSSADAGGGSVDGMNTLLEMASEQSERDIARIVKERVCLQENAKILYPPLSAPAALGRAVDSGLWTAVSATAAEVAVVVEEAVVKVVWAKKHGGDGKRWPFTPSPFLAPWPSSPPAIETPPRPVSAGPLIS